MTTLTPATVPTDSDHVLPLLAAVFEGADAVLAALEPGDEDRATPCPGWNVDVVAEHIIGAVEMFAAAVGDPGTTDPAGPDATRPDGPRIARYRAASAAAMAAWTAPGRLDRPVDLPFGTFPAPLAATINALETYVHAADIAVAVDRRPLIDAALCERIQRRAVAAGFDAFRQPGMFGPAVDAAGATGLEALLAFTGRQVG